MRSKRAFQLGAAVIAGMIIIWLVLSAGRTSLGPAPVSVNHIGHTNDMIRGRVVSLDTFCVTNHTPKSLLIHFWAEPIQAVTNHAFPNAQSSYLTIVPNAATNFTIEFERQDYPTNTWRLKGYAAEVMSGSPAVLQAVRIYPRFLLWRYKNRSNTNLVKLVPSPFAKGQAIHGNYRQIFSNDLLSSK